LQDQTPPGGDTTISCLQLLIKSSELTESPLHHQNLFQDTR